jgi:hypothetical protein
MRVKADSEERMPWPEGYFDVQVLIGSTAAGCETQQPALRPRPRPRPSGLFHGRDDIGDRRDDIDDRRY